MTTTNKAFAILSVSHAPTATQVPPALTPSPNSHKTGNRTIMFDPKEHRRQRKIAWQQHVRWTLRQLRESDNLFLDNSITTAEDEHTDLDKNNTTNAKRKAIDLAHGTQDKPSIGLAQCGRNTAYIMSSAFNRTFKKLNKSAQHFSVASHNSHYDHIRLRRQWQLHQQEALC